MSKKEKRQGIILKVCDLLTQIGLETNDDEVFCVCEEIRNALPESHSAKNEVLLNSPVAVPDSVEPGELGISGEQVSSDAPPRVSPADGGCWFCHTKTDNMILNRDFDTYVHAECVASELDTGNPEAEIMQGDLL